MSFDPPAPPEGGGSEMRAKNLKNQPIVIRADSMGIGKGKDKDGNPTEYEYVSCTVWAFDRSGVTESDHNVQISWWRVREQLRNYVGGGMFIAGKPVESGDNSIILLPLEGAARDVAQKIIDGIQGGSVEDPKPKQQAPTALMQAMVESTYDDDPSPF